MAKKEMTAKEAKEWISAYAKRKDMTVDEAAHFILTVGIHRKEALDNHAKKKAKAGGGRRKAGGKRSAKRPAAKAAPRKRSAKPKPARKPKANGAHPASSSAHREPVAEGEQA